MSDTVTIFGPQSGSIVKDRISLRVQTREKWTDSWETQEFLVCLWAQEDAAPSISTAKFLYHYGEAIKREAESTFSSEEPPEFRGHFVRLQVLPEGSGESGQASGNEDPETVWTGIITHEDFDVHGATATTGPQGDLVLRAYGLEHLLDRVTIRGAYVADGGDIGAGDEDPMGGGAVGGAFIGWAPVHNDRYRRGVREKGNKAAGGTAPMFGGDDEVWTNGDVADYLLTFYGPEEVEFKLAGQTDALDSIVDRHAFEGVSLFQALNALIPRGRGVGWQVRVDKNGTVEVWVFTVIGEAVSVGDASVPANGERVSFKFDDAQDIRSAHIVLDEAATYDRVIVQGERLRSVFTLAVRDETLEQAWSTAVRKSYQAGAGEEDPKLNDAERRRDAYHRVYSMFRVPADWDWKVGDGSGNGEADNVAAPYVEEDGTVNQKKSGPYWTHGLAFLRELSGLERATAGASDTEPEYERPMAFLPVDVEAEENPAGPSQRAGSSTSAPVKKWCHVEALNALEKSPYRLRMVDREGAVELSGAHAHTLAKGDWTEAETGTKPASTNHPPELSWRNLVVTVCADTDLRCKVETRTSEKVATDRPERILTLQVRDAHVWCIAAGTVVGVEEGDLVRHAAEVLRDDTSRLEAIAAYARAWYGQERATVRLEVDAIRAGLKVGQYVTDASSATQRKNVGTVITSKRFDCVKMRTAWKTAYTEHDWERMA